MRYMRYILINHLFRCDDGTTESHFINSMQKCGCEMEIMIRPLQVWSIYLLFNHISNLDSDQTQCVVVITHATAHTYFIWNWKH